MSINKFGVGLKSGSIRASEYLITKLIDKILRLKHFLWGNGQRFNAEGKRITNVATPAEDSDSANKRYVDKKVEHVEKLIAVERYTVFTREMITINAKRNLHGFLIVEPFDSISYKFVYPARISIAFVDFSPNEAEIFIGGKKLEHEQIENREEFISVQASTEIHFKKVGTIKKPFLHCELLIASNTMVNTWYTVVTEPLKRERRAETVQGKQLSPNP